jgi:hypothetical protein
MHSIGKKITSLVFGKEFDILELHFIYNNNGNPEA